MTFQNAALICVVGLAGACAGSFIDAAAYRTVRDKKWWGAERSACASCGAAISARDLVPVLSYIALRGKCRSCGAGIPKRHLYTETVSAALAMLFTAYFGFTWALAYALAALVFLLFHSLTDIEDGYIYDSWVAAMAVAAFALRLGGGVAALIDGAAGAVLGFCSIYAIVLLSRGGMGSGDATLAAGIGALFGWKLAILALYGGFVVGGIWAAVMLAAKKISRKDPVPLGPFLAVGCAAALFTYRFVFAFFGVAPNFPWDL